MSLQAFPTFHILEAKLANVNDRFAGELLRIGRKVPRLDSVASELNHVDVLHPHDHVVAVSVAAASVHHAARLRREGAIPWASLGRLRLQTPAGKKREMNLKGEGGGFQENIQNRTAARVVLDHVHKHL